MIYDAHTHIGAGAGPVSEQLAELRRGGIAGAVFAPGTLAATAADLDSGNSEALELYEQYPDFLYPGVAVNPAFPDLSRRWLQEFRRRGLVWCGENVSYISQIPYADRRWTSFFAFCQRENMVVQLHNAPETADIAAGYPDLTLVASHLDPEILPRLVPYRNVLVDISGFQGGLVRGTLPRALELFGPERLLFGTDFPIYDAEPFVLRFRRDLPLSAQSAVGSGNLTALFRARGVKRLFGMDLTMEQ